MNTDCPSFPSRMSCFSFLFNLVTAVKPTMASLWSLSAQLSSPYLSPFWTKAPPTTLPFQTCPRAPQIQESSQYLQSCCWTCPLAFSETRLPDRFCKPHFFRKSIWWRRFSPQDILLQSMMSSSTDCFQTNVHSRHLVSEQQITEAGGSIHFQFNGTF